MKYKSQVESDIYEAVSQIRADERSAAGFQDSVKFARQLVAQAYERAAQAINASIDFYTNELNRTANSDEIKLEVFKRDISILSIQQQEIRKLKDALE